MKSTILCLASLIAAVSADMPVLPKYTAEQIMACFSTFPNTLSQGATPGAGLYFPGSTEYDFARRGNNGKSVDYFPQVIVAVHEETDIQAAVRCAKILALPVGVQAGGHSYEIGYGSAGIMIYLSPYNLVTSINFVNSNDPANHSKVTFQSGTRNARLYSSMLTACSAPTNPYGCNFLLSSGTFFDVGSGGHAVCGGYGNYGRSIGLLSDQVEEMVVIVGDGSRVVANKVENSDLFWALRGGCSSALGIVSSFTVRLFYHAEGMITHISFRPLPEAKAAALEYASRCGPMLDDRFSIINNIEKGTVGGLFRGTLAQATQALVGVPCGIEELGQICGVKNVVKGNFREKLVYDSIMDEFSTSAAYKNHTVATLDDMLGIVQKGNEGGRYFMHDLVFQKPMPMEVAKSFVMWMDDGTIDSFGFKARNGVNSKLAADGQVYTDDAFGPAWRGILYEIHIGMSSGRNTKDNMARIMLENVVDILRPYMAPDVAYPGYMYFTGRTTPSGAEYFGEANVARLQAVRLKYDPENILGNRVGAHMYPVPKDIPLSDYEGKLLSLTTPPGGIVIPHIWTPADDVIAAQNPADKSGIVSMFFTAIVGSFLFAFAFLSKNNNN